VVEHIVLFKFKKETKKEQKDEALQRIKALKDEIQGIVEIKNGYNFSNQNQEFELGLTVTFENKKFLENYGPNPKHQEIVTYLKEIGLIDLLVVDFEIQ
jgi:hypothetical protein